MARREREIDAERALDKLNDIISSLEDELETATTTADSREEERNYLLDVLDEINELEEHDVTGFGNLGIARRIAGAALKKYR